ncbi:protein tweety [Eupeodes corollae]|uniref:protein tweety n=1 Tax=Eupeodes corollae TaxID=290404 RepID=UPI002492C47A|nr:protein tweety [Eupeodes corollae]
MGDYHEYTDQYKVPVIAKLLHALPHYNITFHKINSTFRPNDEIYLESLGILGSAPAALLIISLLGLLLYLMTRCCDRKPRPAHSITSLKVALSIVTVMCCAAIGLGLYGNDDLHNGLLEVLTAGRKVDNLVTTIRNQTHILENTLKNRIRPQLVELADIFDQPVNNQTALSILFVSLNIVQGNVTLATNAAGDIRRPLMGISMTHYLSRGDQWELIRWPGTVATLALLLVLCAVLLVGVARHSRCALILFSVCGLLAVTGSWLMSGLYLSSSVAVGDLCINPADFLVLTAPRDLPTNVLLHYTQCEPGHTNPFTQRLRESQNSLNNARSAMATVMKISLVLFKSSGLQPKLGAVNADLNSSERLLTQLTALVDCKVVHHNFLTAARGLCEGGLLGLVLMLIASFIAAILLTIMVWVDSHTWIYIRKRNDYAQVDEPSYISHPAPQNHQQMMNARTLPRNPNGHFSPPAISGSHTLQHPSKRQQQHDMMGHAHMQQNMRAMGTHTLGRLPSHNHSPTHLTGPNNESSACSDMNNRQPSQQPIYCHHPHPHSHAAAAAAAAAHAHYHHQHQHQQQYPYVPASAQQLQQQQNQIYQQIPAQLGPMPVTSGNPHSIYQSTSGAAPIYVSNSATMRRQSSQGSNGPHSLYGQHPQHQQSHQPLPPHMQQHPGPMSNQLTTKSPPKETIEVPSSNSIDSAMYERDKQIYKCSTLRQGGKFDPKYKPSILNCPLPEIPKDAGESPKREEPSNNYSKTLQRPPMKLPPHMKVISPPRIENPSLTPSSQSQNGGNNHMNGQAMTTTSNPSPPSTTVTPTPPGATNTQTKSPPPPSAVSMGSSPPKVGTPLMSANNNLSNGDDQDLPPPPPPALNDESNYAVTEL